MIKIVLLVSLLFSAYSFTYKQFLQKKEEVEQKKIAKRMFVGVVCKKGFLSLRDWPA